MGRKRKLFSVNVLVALFNVVVARGMSIPTERMNDVSSTSRASEGSMIEAEGSAQMLSSMTTTPESWLEIGSAEPIGQRSDAENIGNASVALFSRNDSDAANIGDEDNMMHRAVSDGDHDCMQMGEFKGNAQETDMMERASTMPIEGTLIESMAAVINETGMKNDSMMEKPLESGISESQGLEDASEMTSTDKPAAMEDDMADATVNASEFTEKASAVIDSMPEKITNQCKFIKDDEVTSTAVSASPLEEAESAEVETISSPQSAEISDSQDGTPVPLVEAGDPTEAAMMENMTAAGSNASYMAEDSNNPMPMDNFTTSGQSLDQLIANVSLPDELMETDADGNRGIIAWIHHALCKLPKSLTDVSEHCWEVVTGIPNATFTERTQALMDAVSNTPEGEEKLTNCTLEDAGLINGKGFFKEGALKFVKEIECPVEVQQELEESVHKCSEGQDMADYHDILQCIMNVYTLHCEPWQKKKQNSDSMNNSTTPDPTGK